MGEDGKELRDPPLEVTRHWCGGCELMEDAREELREENKDRAGRRGVHLRFRRIEDGPASDPG